MITNIEPCLQTCVIITSRYFFFSVYSGRKTVDECGLTRYLAGLAERVAETGDPINIGECTNNGLENGLKSSPIKSLLAMPIRNKNYQIIGEQLIDL